MIFQKGKKGTRNILLEIGSRDDILQYMKELLHRHSISFVHAWDGILWAVGSQPNFAIHLTLSIVALALGIALNVSRVEMVLLIFTILLGLTVEMVNTSIESITDLVTHEWHKEAKIAKDVSAGAMLLVAIGATLVGSAIFIPYISRLFGI